MFLSTGMVLSLACGSVSAQPSKPPKPDLHAGGPQPSLIPNDEVTEVVLPGLHLTGAKLDGDRNCKVVSYEVSSDKEIRMKIKGTRAVDESEEACYIKVSTAGGSATFWIVVELTEAQQAIADAHKRAAEAANASAFQSRSGKTWKLHFAGGASETYTLTGNNPDGMPTFQSNSGAEAQIAVSKDNMVTIIGTGCMRFGKLVGSEVKNGESRGDCNPPGSWTATVEH